MNVLIIEDEPLAADRLCQLLSQADDSMQVVGVADSVEASVTWLESHSKPDLILMDIELSDGQSFAIFDQVKISTPVIFTTSYDDYAIQAFKVNSIDYLLKPVKPEDLKTAIEKLKTFGNHLPFAQSAAVEQVLRQLHRPEAAYRERFLVKSGQRYFSIEVNDIAYFFFRNRVTFLKTWKKESYYIDYVMDELEEMLPPQDFFRANRQYLINVKSVKDIQPFFNNKLKLTLSPAAEEDVLVSRERAADFKNWMGK